MSDTWSSDGSENAGENAGRDRTILDLVALTSNRPEQVVNRLRAYWRGLCGDRLVPDRVDVTAEGLGPSRDYAFILERVAPGSARLRLAGRHLVDLMGMEVRGMPISALFTPGYRGQLSDVLESVFQTPQLAEMFLMSPATATEAPGMARMLLMPLKSDLGDVTRILGCLVADSLPHMAPRRFDLVSETLQPIEGSLPVQGRGDESAGVSPDMSDRAGWSPDPRMQMAPDRGRGTGWHPRLIVDNDPD